MQSRTNQRNRMNPLLKCCNLIKKPPKVPQTRVTKQPSFVFSSTDWWIWKRNLWIWRKIFKYLNCFVIWRKLHNGYKDHLSAVSALFFLNSPKKNKASCFLRLPLPFTQAATLLWMFVKILDISGVFLRFCPTFIHLALTHECSEMTTNNFTMNFYPFFFSVRGSRPGKNVQLTENEIRGLCLKSRELFLSQPILLELEAPLKICGEWLICITQILYGQIFIWR